MKCDEAKMRNKKTNNSNIIEKIFTFIDPQAKRKRGAFNICTCLKSSVRRALVAFSFHLLNIIPQSDAGI